MQVCHSGLRKYVEVERADLLKRLAEANSTEKVEFVALRVFCLYHCIRPKIDSFDITLKTEIASLQRKTLEKYNEVVQDEPKIQKISELNIHTEKIFIEKLDQFNRVLLAIYDERPIHREKAIFFDPAYEKLMCTHLAEKDCAMAHLCLGLSFNFTKLNCPPLDGIGEKEKNHLKIAASLGNINASYYLGLASKELEEQMNYITHAAINGHIGALVQAALLHRVDGNSEQAAQYLEKAYEDAFIKDPIAQALSDLYLEMDRGDLSLRWKYKVNARGLAHSAILNKGPTLHRYT